MTQLTHSDSKAVADAAAAATPARMPRRQHETRCGANGRCTASMPAHDRPCVPWPASTGSMRQGEEWAAASDRALVCARRVSARRAGARAGTLSSICSCQLPARDFSTMSGSTNCPAGVARAARRPAAAPTFRCGRRTRLPDAALRSRPGSGGATAIRVWTRRSLLPWAPPVCWSCGILTEVASRAAAAHRLRQAQTEGAEARGQRGGERQDDARRGAWRWTARPSRAS
ncbi:MAG: hypothetical protein MZV65_39910 [Chromatiales bacterium]|nr:hypothetical protein [Chromatiales bacterium]